MKKKKNKKQSRINLNVNLNKQKETTHDFDIRYGRYSGNLSSKGSLYNQFVTNFCYPTSLKIKF